MVSCQRESEIDFSPLSVGHVKERKINYPGL